MSVGKSYRFEEIKLFCSDCKGDNDLTGELTIYKGDLVCKQCLESRKEPQSTF